MINFLTLFLPVIMAGYSSGHPKAMAAWLHAPISDAITMEIGAGFYNYRTCSGWTNSYKNQNGVPMLWADYDSRTNVDFYFQAATCLSDYNDWAIIMNEPDERGVDPRKAAVIFHTFETLMPHAKLITPNVNSREYLFQFIQAYKTIYGHIPEPAAWGFHGYTLTDGRMGRTIDEFCDVLSRFSIKCTGLWITEYGSCDPTIMYQSTATLVWDDRVDIFGVFTNRRWGCLNLVNDDGTLTKVGEAFVRALWSDRPRIGTKR